MEIVIRPAAPEDTEEIIRNTERMAMESEGRLLNPERVRAGVTHLIHDHSRGFYLIADVDGMLAGQLMVTYEWSDWHCGDYWWIQSVYIAPHLRRKGIFTTLYQNIIKRATESEQVVGVRLYVETENHTAKKTYQTLGMNQTQYEMFESQFTQ
ncbi:MAG TPA: GNAT family N-acetyltransferase [Methanospirillum sp.]|nr:GNAT family N-acetyltransferase [Methanospirillum sp.]